MPTGMEAARFEQAAAHHPEPPFVLGEKIKDGGTCCYYPECKYKAKTWLRMLEHVRLFHKRNQTTLRGTLLYIMGMEEAAANLRLRLQHRYTSDPASHPEPPFVLGGKIKEGGPAAIIQIVNTEHRLGAICLSMLDIFTGGEY